MGLIDLDYIELLNINSINICDLGCGIPKETFNIIKKLNSPNFTLVDKQNIPIVDSVNFGEYLSATNTEDQPYIKKYLELKSSDFLYNEYLIHTLNTAQPRLSQKEFNNRIERNFSTDAIEYLKSDKTTKFDVMIISKLFANVSCTEQLKIMSLIPTIMNTASLIFVRLNYTGYESMNVLNSDDLKIKGFEKVNTIIEELSEVRSNKLIILGRNTPCNNI